MRRSSVPLPTQRDALPLFDHGRARDARCDSGCWDRASLRESPPIDSLRDMKISTASQECRSPAQSATAGDGRSPGRSPPTSTSPPANRSSSRGGRAPAPEPSADALRWFDQHAPPWKPRFSSTGSATTPPSNAPEALDTDRGEDAATPTAAADDTAAPSIRQIREDLVARGDLLALLEQIEASPAWNRTAAALDQVTRCVRQLACDNLDGLNDAVFAIILGTANTLLVRCRLVISEELGKHDACGGGSADLPPELVEQGWLERFERLAKFVAEMASVRARLQHLKILGDQANGPDSSAPRKPRLVPAMAEGTCEAGSSEAVSSAKRRRVRPA